MLIKNLRDGASFSHNNKWYFKQDPEYTPNGKSNAKDQITGEYIYIDENTEIKPKTIRTDYF